MTKCPQCGSNRVGRSHTRWHERPKRWLLGGRPYRCSACDWRGWLESGTARTPGATRRRPRGSRNEFSIAIGFIIAVVVALAVFATYRSMTAPAPAATGQQGPLPATGKSIKPDFPESK